MEIEHNFVSVDNEKDLADLIEREYQGDRTIGDVVRFLYRRGLINKKAARNELIKEFYYVQIKHQSALESRLDCAANFDVSERQVQRIIYEYVKS